MLHHRTESEAIIARLFNVSMAAGLEDVDGVFNREPEDAPIADVVRLAHRCNHAWLFNTGNRADAIAAAVSAKERRAMAVPTYTETSSMADSAVDTTSAGSSPSAAQMDINSPKCI